MFFIASKILGYLLQPSVIIAGAALVGALLSFTRLQRAGRWISLLASLALIGVIFTPVSFIALGTLEYRIAKPSRPDRVDGIVVLGGSIDNLITKHRNKPELFDSGDRLTEAAILANLYPDAKLLYSGSSVHFGSSHQTEADFAQAFWTDLGVAQSRILIEGKARNTYENALFSKRLANQKPGDTWLLVTSAFHMPRSYSIFRNAGWGEIIPWPVDYRTRGWRDRTRISTASRKHIAVFDLAVREYIGLLAYWLTGRTDQLWPKL